MSEYLNDFISFIEENDENLRIESLNLEEANKDLCDIEHYIEFGSADGKRMLKIYKLCQEARRKRRKAKEQIELSTPIAEWADRNKRSLQELQEVLGVVHKVERLQSMRTYAIRGHALDGITTKTHLRSESN